MDTWCFHGFVSKLWHSPFQKGRNYTALIFGPKCDSKGPFVGRYVPLGFRSVLCGPSRCEFTVSSALDTCRVLIGRKSKRRGTGLYNLTPGYRFSPLTFYFHRCYALAPLGFDTFAFVRSCAFRPLSSFRHGLDGSSQAYKGWIDWRRPWQPWRRVVLLPWQITCQGGRLGRACPFWRSRGGPGDLRGRSHRPFAR